MRLSPARMQPQAGASLIEILVSVLVISFGILAMAAVQSNSVKFHKTAEYRATATLLAADIADRLRANNSGAQLNAYAWGTTGYAALSAATLGTLSTCGGVTLGTGATTNATLSGCTPIQLAANDLVEWKTRLSLSLPGASGHIGAFDASTKALDVWVAWLDPDEVDRANKSTLSASPECPGKGVWTSSTLPYRCLFLRVAL